MGKVLTDKQKQALHKAHRISEVVKTFKELEDLYDGMDKFIGVDPDAPMFRIAYELFTKYLDSVAALVGDPCTWLSWYVWDNECGKRALRVAWTENGKRKEVHVRTPLQLVRVMEGHADK